jgi:hypothetical protein
MFVVQLRRHDMAKSEYSQGHINARYTIPVGPFAIAVIFGALSAGDDHLAFLVALHCSNVELPWAFHCMSFATTTQKRGSTTVSKLTVKFTSFSLRNTTMGLTNKWTRRGECQRQRQRECFTRESANFCAMK